MSGTMHFLIVDGYPKESRDVFDAAGMVLAAKLYAKLLLQHLPGATYEILFSSDEGVALPGAGDLKSYAGVLWPGCNLTVYNKEDPRVERMIALCREVYAAGIPQFGSCWGIQLAVYTAGGEVRPNPRGREMCIGRKIRLTDKGLKHPMFRGKPPVFSHLVSHDDMVTRIPGNAELLATNDFANVQAVAVKHKKGIFWATQYHPEYDLHEMARLIVARTEILVHLGFFTDAEDCSRYVDRLETLFANPGRKDLGWQLAIDDDILSDSIRQCEFVNWINYIMPAKRRNISAD